MAAPRTVTSAASAINGDIVLVNAAGGAVTVTLASSADARRRPIVVKKIDSSGNAVTVATEGAEKIDGSDTKSLASQWSATEVAFNGTDWFTI